MTELASDLLSELGAQRPLQWVALFTGLLYVVFAARANAICWIFGIVCSAAIAWEDFVSMRLYADGVLQVIYIILGFAGLVAWMGKNERTQSENFRTVAVTTHIAAIGIAALASLPVWYVLANYTSAAYGYFDTLTTLLSLFATWLLIRRVVSNWLYWIAIDAVYVFLFARTDGTLIAALYAIYTAIAVVGFFKWRRMAWGSSIESSSK